MTLLLMLEHDLDGFSECAQFLCERKVSTKCRAHCLQWLCEVSNCVWQGRIALGENCEGNL